MADEQRMNRISPSATTETDRQEGEPASPARRRRTRSQSPSPRRNRDRVDESRRDRDREGDRDHPRHRKDAGFKWKEKRKDDDTRRDERDQNTGLHRGYKDHYRPRSRSPRKHNEGVNHHRPTALSENKPDERGEERREERREKKEKRPAPTQPTEPMIIVYVNDRLGTKKAVPCYASDPIKDFKVIVASMIGRQPHEILLKRQGERPFKDILTLRDYGVSNNVQLDLEVDTGD